RDQFLQVLDAALVLRVGGLLEFGDVAGALEDGFQQECGAGACGQLPAQVRQQAGEALDRVQRPRRQAVRLVGAVDRRTEGDTFPLRQRVEHRLRALADAALGYVDDSPQRDRVVRVRQSAQVRERILDLLALVEADA